MYYGIFDILSQNLFFQLFWSHPLYLPKWYGFTVGFPYCGIKGFGIQNRKNHRSRCSDGVRRQIRLQNYVELHCGSTGNSLQAFPSDFDALNRKNRYLPQNWQTFGKSDSPSSYDPIVVMYSFYWKSHKVRFLKMGSIMVQ